MKYDTYALVIILSFLTGFVCIGLYHIYLVLLEIRSQLEIKDIEIPHLLRELISEIKSVDKLN